MPVSTQFAAKQLVCRPGHGYLSTSGVVGIIEVYIFTLPSFHSIKIMDHPQLHAPIPSLLNDLYGSPA